MNTNFILGEQENPRSAFMTTYKNKLKGRPCLSPARNQKKKFIVNFKISNNEPNDFLSEKQLR